MEKVPTGKIPPHWRIKLLVHSNPKKSGSKAWQRWFLYEDGMTVGEFVAKCNENNWNGMKDIRWNIGHGFLCVQEPRP